MLAYRLVFDFFVDDENKTIKHKSESATNAQTDQISYTHDAFNGPGWSSSIYSIQMRKH